MSPQETGNVTETFETHIPILPKLPNRLQAPRQKNQGATIHSPGKGGWSHLGENSVSHQSQQPGVSLRSPLQTEGFHDCESQLQRNRAKTN